MILYGSSISPFVRKVLAVAGEKGVEITLKPVGVGDRDPEFREASPLGKMPALRDDDYLLADSSAIVHYLEAKYPEPALIPSEPRARGLVIWFEEYADTTLMSTAAKMFFNRVVAPRFMKRSGDAAAADAAERDELPVIFGYLEKVIPAEGFLVGDSFSLADIAIASPLANFAYMNAAIDADRYPRLAAFVERTLARPSFDRWLAKERTMFAPGGPFAG